MTKIKKRTKFDILRELREVEQQLLGVNEDSKGFVVRTPTPSVELMKKKAQLRHELKMIDRKTATGADAEAIKKHQLRIMEEERKKQEAQKKIEAQRIEQAKKKLAQEVTESDEALDKFLETLSPEQRQKLKNKL